MGARSPLAPNPAVAERRASDVLPADHSAPGTSTWVAALVAAVARTGWLAVLLAVAFLAGSFGVTWARGRSLTSATPWALIGGGGWLALALVWSVIRAKR